MRPTFQASYCAATGCPPSAFSGHVLRRTFPLHVAPLARLLLWAHPAFFSDDLRLIESCGPCRALSQIRNEVSGYFTDFPRWPFSRRRLHLRLSTRKLIRLAKTTALPPAPRAQAGLDLPRVEAASCRFIS